MKKSLPFFPLLILLSLLIGCSEENVSSENTTISRDIVKKPNILDINFNVKNTTYSFTQSDSNMQFSVNPKLYCYTTLHKGNGYFKLFDSTNTIIYNRQFEDGLEDTLVFSTRPWKYIISIENYEGYGNIHVYIPTP